VIFRQIAMVFDPALRVGTQTDQETALVSAFEAASFPPLEISNVVRFRMSSSENRARRIYSASSPVQRVIGM
jgi:hypothetical protein